MKDSEMEDYIGSKVAKVFPGYGSEPFKGKVTGITDVEGRKYFRVKYADGDTEDITKATLLKILVDEEEEKDTVKNKRGRPPSSKKKPTVIKRTPAPETAPQRSKQRKIAQPTRGKRPEAIEQLAETEEEEEEELVKVSEDEGEKQEEDQKEDQGEQGKSPLPTAAAVGGARAHISSFLTAGKKLLVGDADGDQEQGGTGGSGGHTNLLQQLLTQSEDIEEELEKEKEEEGGVDKEIAPHEYLYPSTTAAAATTAGKKKKKKSKEQEDDTTIQRFQFSGPPLPADGISASTAVAANGLLFISALTRPGIIGYKEEGDTPPDVYTDQIAEVLEDLDQILKKAGCAGKESLVSVDVQFKDSAVGYAPFVAEWNKWLGDAPAPAMKMGESFMGEQCVLVSLRCG